MASPPAPVVRRRPHATTLIVAAIGIALAIALALLTEAAYRHTEQRLVRTQGALTAATLGADPLFVQAHLAAAADLAEGTTAPRGNFTQAMAGIVGKKGPFATASLWSLGPGQPHEIVQIGAAPLLDPSSAAARRFVRQAPSASFDTMRLADHGKVRLAYVVAAGAGHHLAVYAEEPLPANRQAAVPASSPIHPMNLALYLGPSVRHGVLLERYSASPLPLQGDTTTQHIAFGNTKLTLVMSPRRSLSGQLAEYAPMGIGVVVFFVGLLAAFGTERLARRRDRAEQRAAESRRLLEVERSIARTLQHSLLPEALPRCDGFAFAVRYLPGAVGTEVGGDWYDVIEVDDEHLFFSIGDVSGRGIRAAALMGTLRNTINAYAHEGHQPGAVLRQLAPLVSIRDGRFATVLCGTINTTTGAMRLANAGHLPPLLVSAERAQLLEVPHGPPIGVRAAAYPESVLTLGEGETLIAYTDGLVERRGEILTTGLDRLRCSIDTSRPPEDTLDAALEQMGVEGANDDVAVLAIQRVAAPASEPAAAPLA
ncbi:MAG: PP2C family protein-serine/threonine phosphatase [Actinomycetota bacterium]|nr:PP2C family protein-serine/threonine phosphatase [Actinomycetota bacterium]